MTGVGGRTGVRHWIRLLHWYLREITGEADYDHYLAAQARHSAAHEATRGPVVGSASVVMSRREFEQRRWADRERTPGNRCC